MKTKFFITILLTSSILVLSSCNHNPIVVNGKARFTVITPECIRLEYSENGKFINDPSLFASERNVRSNKFKSIEFEGKTIIITSRMKLIYKPNGKAFSPENLEIHVLKGDDIRTWVPGMKNKENLGGTLRTVDGLSGKVDLGEGVLSRDGWYMLDDSKRPLLTEYWVRSRPADAGIDWYFFGYGNDFKAALKALTDIGGKVPLPRKYVFGSWYSRYWPYSQDDYKQIVNEYKEHNFPLDIIVMDMDWHKDGWTGWSWNRKLLPEPEKLLKWFHQQNLAVTMNLHPADGVRPNEDKYRTFMKEMGVNLNGVADTALPTLPFDASNKKYMRKLFKCVLNPLRNSGVDFWWLDWQQDEFTKGMPDLKNLEWFNRCFYRNASEYGMRGQSFSRWGGWGDHKYPIHFSGDAVAVWPMLAFEIPFTSNAGNVGCFFWSHDIGGHTGNFDQETNTRWVQFGAASAALRLHSTRDPNMDKRPWKYKPEYLHSMYIAFHLRSELFPYIYSIAWKSVDESLPLTCPMYIEYPEKEIAYKCPQQYFFGTSILVAPIVSPGTGKNKVAFQNIWFPEGNWFNLFTNEKYGSKDQPITVWADINEFPIFAKGGVPIPMQPFRQRMATAPLDTLVVRTYPGIKGQSGSFTLYEDDGLTQVYKNGKYAFTNLTYYRTGDTSELIIEGTKGIYKNQIKKRSYLIEFPCTQKTDWAIVNGVKIKCKYNYDKQTNIVIVNKMPINKVVKLFIIAPEIDYKQIIENNYERRKNGMIDSSLLRKSSYEILDSYANKDNTNDYLNVLAFLSGLSINYDDFQLNTLKNNNYNNGILSLYIMDTNGEENKNIVSSNINDKSPLMENFDIEMKPLGYGMKTTRFIMLNSVIDKKKINIKAKLKDILPSIMEWKTIGPFNFDSSKNIAAFSYAPENEMNLDTAKSYEGKNGKQIYWQSSKARIDGVVDLNELYKSQFAIAYALTYIHSDIDQNVKFRINSDDGNEVFLNHKKIFSHNIFRAFNGPEDITEGRLKKGTNVLLVKISQGMGGWEFRVKVEAEKNVKILPFN